MSILYLKAVGTLDVQIHRKTFMKKLFGLYNPLNAIPTKY